MDIPAPSDLSTAMEERIYCAITAAQKYEIPSNIMLAVAEQEGGRPGIKVKNKNGTYDFGSMQFNTVYIKYLNSKYGITAEHVSMKGCYPYDLAAWRIYQHIKNDKGDIWKKVSNYHSKTEKFNQRYQVQIKKRAVKWGLWLDKYFNHVDLNNYLSDQSNKNSQQPKLKNRNYTYRPREISFN